MMLKSAFIKYFRTNAWNLFIVLTLSFTGPATLIVPISAFPGLADISFLHITQ